MVFNEHVHHCVGGIGSGDGQFNSPTGITVDANGTVYVVDTGNNRVQKFDSAGNFITKWGTAGSGPGQFSNPTGIELDSAGNVYVADTGNARVQRFTASGTFVNQIVAADGSPPPIASIDLGFDSDGVMYVLDRGDGIDPSTARVQRFAELSALNVVLDTVPNDPQDFSFTAGGGLSPSSFQLDDDGDNGNGLSSTRSFANFSRRHLLARGDGARGLRPDGRQLLERHPGLGDQPQAGDDCDVHLPERRAGNDWTLDDRERRATRRRLSIRLHRRRRDVPGKLRPGR